jgi:FKBP-type peptidyl-prolyl cis-trans isomerase (trigger factor)
MNENQKIQISEEDVNAMVNECIRRCMSINEDMTRSQVENQIDDFMKSKEFEKRVHNIAVDVVSEFIENMWLKKSFWKTMIKKK